MALLDQPAFRWALVGLAIVTLAFAARGVGRGIPRIIGRLGDPIGDIVHEEFERTTAYPRRDLALAAVSAMLLLVLVWPNLFAPVLFFGLFAALVLGLAALRSERRRRRS